MWKTIDRQQPAIDPKARPLLDEPTKEKIRTFFPRYETKRAALLPALHIVQEKLGHISYQAMKEVAELLEIHPSDVIDVVTFYTHFHAHPIGRKVIMVCRSLSCELTGGGAVLEELKEALNIDLSGTTPDGTYTLVTEECLAACDHAPCMLINERMHKKVQCDEIKKILADENNDRLELRRNTLFDPPESAGAAEDADTSGAEGPEKAD